MDIFVHIITWFRDWFWSLWLPRNDGSGMGKEPMSGDLFDFCSTESGLWTRRPYVAQQTEEYQMFVFLCIEWKIS